MACKFFCVVPKVWRTRPTSASKWWHRLPKLLPRQQTVAPGRRPCEEKYTSNQSRKPAGWWGLTTDDVRHNGTFAVRAVLCIHSQGSNSCSGSIKEARILAASKGHSNPFITLLAPINSLTEWIFNGMFTLSSWSRYFGWRLSMHSYLTEHWVGCNITYLWADQQGRFKQLRNREERWL